MPSRAVALTLATVAWCSLALGLLVVALGPLSFTPIGLSISSPTRLFGLSTLLIVLAAVARGPRTLFDDLGQAPSPYGATVVFAALLLAGLLVARGSVSVGGADSAGYLAQATRWHAGAPRTPLPLEIDGLSETAWRQSGLGFRPDPSGTAIVPSYPPGLPWLQVGALWVGGESAAVRGLPLLASLSALLGAFILARPLAGPSGAAFVVLSLASSPPFLFQALQPMSDVPALAAWLIALALAMRNGRRSIVGAALAAFVAILIRPNLAPLVVPVCWQAAMTNGSRTTRLRRPAIVSVAAIVAIVIVATVQGVLYGSPLQSGYGRAEELFSLSHVATNLRLYSGWLVESIGAPALAALVGGAAWLVADGARRRELRPVILMAAMTVVLYLVYVPFDSWTYLRFVLIALALMPIGLARLMQAWPPSGPWRFPIFAVLVLLVVVPNLQRARQLGVFDVRAREYRYLAAGRFVRDHLPPRAVIVAAQHGTSAPYYSGRPVLRADLLDAAALATITTWAARERRPLAFVLDTAEVDALRARLGGDGLMALDWPPRAEIGRPIATRIWLDIDRDAYAGGAAIPTTRLATVP